MFCDSVTAHCYICMPKNSDFGKENVGLATAVVINLSNCMEGKGHVIYTDNYHTSPVLAHNLLNRGIGLLGTCRINRKGFQKELAAMKKKRSEKGRNSNITNLLLFQNGECFEETKDISEWLRPQYFALEDQCKKQPVLYTAPAD